MPSIIEYFLLRDARAEALKTPDAARVAIGRALSLGRQKGEAADALWSNGHAAEGLRLAVDALHAVLDACAPSPSAPLPSAPLPAAPSPAAASEEAAEDGGDAPQDTAAVAASEGPRWRAFLAGRGIPASRLDAFAVLESTSSSALLPVLDAEVGGTHADLYEQSLAARLEVVRAVAGVALTTRDLVWLRAIRIGSVVVVLAVVGGLVSWLTRRPERPLVQASDVFGQSPQFAAGLVLDGREDTEWLLPDHASGWVETRLPEARRVSAVTITNADNPPHFDRATREYRVELYSADRVVGSADGVFDNLEREPAPRRIEVAGDDVDRVRFVVRSTHGAGGGIAELRVEP